MGCIHTLYIFLHAMETRVTIFARAAHVFPKKLVQNEGAAYTWNN